jgi:hypothetical protein
MSIHYSEAKSTGDTGLKSSTGLENPGKSLNWKKIFQDWKVLENQ